MLRLYEDELCGDSYKVRLMLALLGVDYERVRVERYPSAQHETPDFLALNPLGTLPVLDVDGTPLRDAHAILVWLARRHGDAAWLPADDPLRLAQVQTWLGFAARLGDAVFALRDYVLHGIGVQHAHAGADAKRYLRVLDETCWFNDAAGTPFVAGTRAPTIADIACFVPVALLDEAEIDTIDYPALARWSTRIRRLKRFVPMAGVYPAI